MISAPMITLTGVLDLYALSLFQSTTTENGLSVACMPDRNVYETGIKVSDESMDAIDIEYIGPHHGWSYIIKGFEV